MRQPRGQALVLFALTGLLIVVMAFMTVSIAVKSRERLEQQTLADTVAYSNAVASARAYNTLSLVNRTAVSHWVSLMAVQANLSWGSLHKAWFESVADALLSIEQSRGACGNRTEELEDARHSLIHASLSSYNSPVVTNDDVHLGRDHDARTCQLMNERSSNWKVRDFGREDERVARETRAIYGALMDLTDIQNDVYGELQQRVRDGELGDALVKLARGRPSPGPYRFLDGATSGDGPAWEHVNNALGRGLTDADRHRALEPIAHAAMGSRPSSYLIGGRDQNQPPASEYGMKPPWTMDTMQLIERDLDQHFGPGDRFKFVVEHFAVRSWLGASPGTPAGLGRVHSGRPLGFGDVAGGAWARIRVEYLEPAACGGARRTRTVLPNAEMTLNRLGTSRHDFGHRGVEHASAHDDVRCNDPAHVHRHWDEQDASIHYLQGAPDRSIWPRGFGFLFPQNPSDEARNYAVFGQPVMPVLLARSYRPADATPDPWNLTFRLRFSGDAALNLGANPVLADQLALSNAVLYYHRRRANGAGRGDADSVGRSGWRESPNLLNPYWHATLVRSDLGEHATPTRDYDLPVNQHQELKMLRAEGFTSAVEALRELDAAGFDAWQ